MKLRQPTVRQYYTLKYSNDVSAVSSTVRELTGCDENDVAKIAEFAGLFLSVIEKRREESPQFRAPYAPPKKKRKRYFECNTRDLKVVADYTRMSFAELYELDIFDFWAYYHDAVVFNCEQSEEGFDYLEKAHIYAQTEPDRESLRELFGGAKNGVK